MKNALLVCALVVCSNGYGQERLVSKIFRRATLAASCAASFWDYQTTARGARYGAVERGLLSDNQGRPRLGLMLGVKSGMCAMSVVTQETNLLGRRRDSFSPLFTAYNGLLTTRYVQVSLHNLSVIKGLQNQTQQPAQTPAAAGQ